MPLLDVDSKIVYGAITIGGAAASTNYHLVRVLTYSETHDEARVEFEALCQHDVEATFVARCSALRDAFRIPEQRLQILLGSTERRDYDPSDHSGFDARPEIALIEEDQTDRSARFRISVQVSLPADKASRAGRRLASIETTELPSGRRGVRISGVWTGITSNNAAAQYAAQITAYGTAILAAIDGSATWQLVGQTTTETDTGTTVQFSRDFEERLINESVGTLNDAQLSRPRLLISVGEQGNPAGTTDSSSALPVRVNVTHTVFVDKAVTDLRTLWETKVRDHIYDQIDKHSDVGDFAVVSERPTYDAEDRSITTEIELLAFGAVTVVEEMVETTESLTQGFRFIPLADGDAFSFRRYKGPQIWTRQIVRTVIRRPTGGEAPPEGGGGVELKQDEPEREAQEVEGQFRITGFKVDEGWHVIEEQTTLRGPYLVGNTKGQVTLEGFVEIVTMFRADVVEGGEARGVAQGGGESGPQTETRQD